MPSFQFTFEVQGITQQRAGVIRDRIIQRLGEDSVTVTSMNSAQTTTSFRVVGVDTATSEVFDETVDATSDQAARALVIGAVPTRVVALVRER